MAKPHNQDSLQDLTIVELIEARCRRHPELGFQGTSGYCQPGVFRRFASREIIVREGSPVTHIGFLVKGTLALSVLGHSWNRRIVMLLFAPDDDQDSIIDPTALQSEKHSLTCEALTDVEVYLIEKSTLDTLVEADCALAYQISYMLSKLHGRIIAEFQNQVALPAPERLARILLRLAKSYGQPNQDRIRLTLPLKRQDLASLVGVSKETLIRMLQAFKSDGLIDLADSEIDIVSESHLRALAHQTPASFTRF